MHQSVGRALPVVGQSPTYDLSATHKGWRYILNADG
jgi:hypothetical protein